MGIKKFFKVKPPTQEETESNLRERMGDKGLPTKSASTRPSVFGAYANYANDKTVKKVYAPKGYEQLAENNRGEKVFKVEEDDLNSDVTTDNKSNNPYGSLNSTNSQNPYAGISTSSKSSSGNPYGTINSNNSQANPNQSNGYGYASNGSGSNSYQREQQTLSNSLNAGYSGQRQQGYPNERQQQHQGYPADKQQQHQGYPAEKQQQHQGYPAEKQQQQPQSSNPYSNSSRIANPYASQQQQQQQQPSNHNPYAKQRSSNDTQANRVAVDEDDLNYVPEDEDEDSVRVPPSYRQSQLQHPRQQQNGFDFEEDLNADVAGDDYNYGYQPELEPEPELTEEELAQQQEDEETEQIKNQIRFTKQESVASTRNTLKMGRDAVESGQNTLGMLGAQSEMLYDVERNLTLAEAQSGIAKGKIGEIHHYNRSMFKPSMQNPFTKKKRLRDQEAKIKSDRIHAKVEAEHQRSELSSSTNRIKASLNESAGLGDSVTNKYRRERIQNEAKRYQFENDSEDDEMENEIGENLDEIGKLSGQLKKLAMTQAEEIDRQNYRIKDVEEAADKLDINVHLNTASLSRAR